MKAGRALLVGGDIWVPSNEMDKKQGGWSSTKDNKKCNRGEIIDIEASHLGIQFRTKKIEMVCPPSTPPSRPRNHRDEIDEQRSTQYNNN